MNEKTITAIGLGPGDPELITLKGWKALQEADLVICPTSREKEKGIAYEILSHHVTKQKIKTLYFPMVREESFLEAAWKENSKEVLSVLEEGQKICFGVLGDVMLYSTYLYIAEELAKENIKSEYIPGIHSYSAVASSLSLPLALWEESFCVIPLQPNEEKLEKALELHENVVVMKASHNIEELKRIGKKEGVLLYGVSYVSQEREMKFYDVEELDKIPYMSTIFLKKTKSFFRK